MQLLAGGQLRSAGPGEGSPTALRTASETLQRCGPAGGRIRPAGQAHARQFPAGVLARGAGEFRPQSAACAGASDHGRSHQAQAPAACGPRPAMSANSSGETCTVLPELDRAADALFLDIDGTMIDIAPTPESVIV